MVAWPEIMTVGVGSSVCFNARSTSMPLPSGSRTSSRYRSARPAPRCAWNSAADAQIVTA
jgi:hypothetical protein